MTKDFFNTLLRPCQMAIAEGTVEARPPTRWFLGPTIRPETKFPESFRAAGQSC